MQSMCDEDRARMAIPIGLAAIESDRWWRLLLLLLMMVMMLIYFYLLLPVVDVYFRFGTTSNMCD